jgi:S-adenosylmethionine hydrolase
VDIFANEYTKNLSYLFLISDFQSGSHKIGMLKTKWLTIDNQLNIIDFTHDVQLNNTIEAAFIGKQIQLIDNQTNIIHFCVGKTQTSVVYQQDNNVFIFPNNGLISLFIDKPISQYAYLLKKGEELQFVNDLINHRNPQKSNQTDQIVLRYNRMPNSLPNILVAECVFIDKFGNCYFNIDKSGFYSFVGNQKFSIKIQHYTGLVFEEIVESIIDVDPGDAAFSFGSNEHLKLQIHLGNAKQLFRIKEETKITIEIK